MGTDDDVEGLVEDFVVADRVGNGFITAAEFMQYFELAGGEITDVSAGEKVRLGDA